MNVNESTLLVCEIVLNQYLDVLAETPECTTAEFKKLVVDAEVDVRRARQDLFMFIQRQVEDVPTVVDQASLLQLTAKG